jgi:very-short-patch-repair endonuclease
VTRAARRKGGVILAKLLDLRRPSVITQSEAERRFLELVHAAGLPRPQTQIEIAGFTVDFLWPEQRVVFEVDGFGYHASRSAFNRDRRKDAVLKAHRFDPNRVTRDQVKYEPLMVVADVASALARGVD